MSDDIIKVPTNHISNSVPHGKNRFRLLLCMFDDVVSLQKEPFQIGPEDTVSDMSKAKQPMKNGVGNNATSKSGSTVSIWKRAITANSEWPDKDEFLDVIYWSRQVIGIIVGIIWGLIPLKGFIALLLFALVNAGLIYIYFSSFQSIDEEEYGGAWELTKEGFMTSFAGFLVTWIIIYSGLHFD